MPPHLKMVAGRKVLREIVGSIQLALGSIQIELLLGNSIFDPMIPHVKRLGAFHADLGLQDVVSGGIVGFNGRAKGRLGMSHLCEGCDQWASFLTR